ncbi:MAG TPA: SRPBCC family protein [Gaiellaceae bacterium]
MLEITTSTTTSLTPEQVIGAAADFSDAREKLWPNSKNKYFQVHDQGADFAEVTEGLRMIGVFWERSRYDWSEPGTIRQTVIDSNVVWPSSTWELAATSQGEGSKVVMHLSREFRPSIKGRVGWALNHLAGARMWGSYVRSALAEAESRS